MLFLNQIVEIFRPHNCAQHFHESVPTDSDFQNKQVANDFIPKFHFQVIVMNANKCLSKFYTYSKDSTSIDSFNYGGYHADIAMSCEQIRPN